MNMIKNLFKNTFVYGISSILGRTLNFLLIPLHTRIYKESELGLITELYVYATFLNIIYTYGMETAYFRFSKSNKEEKIFNQIYSLLIITSIILSIIFLSLSPIFAVWIKNKYAQKYIFYLVIILFIDTISMLPLARLRYFNEAKKFTIVQIVKIFSNFFLTLLFVYFLRKFYLKPNISFLHNIAYKLYNPKLKIDYIFISNLISSIIVCIISISTIVNYRFKLSAKLVYRIIRYSFPLLIVGILGNFNDTISRPLVKYLIPKGFYPCKTNEEMLGIFGACYKLSIFMNLVIQAFRYAVEPILFKKMVHINYKRSLSEIMEWFIIITCLIMFLISMNLDLIAKIMIGKKFRLAIEIVPYLLLSYLILGIYYNISIWYKIMNKTYFGIIFVLIGTIITIIFNFILTPIYGYWGPIYTTLLAYTFMTLFCYCYGQKLYKIQYNIKSGISYLLFTFTSIFILRLYLPVKFDHKVIYGLIVSTIGIIIFYILEKNKLSKILYNKS